MENGTLQQIYEWDNLNFKCFSTEKNSSSDYQVKINTPTPKYKPYSFDIQ